MGLRAKMTKKEGIVFLLCIALGICVGLVLKRLDSRQDGKVFDLSQAVVPSSGAEADGYPYEENTKEKYGKININTAGAEELDQLPGIGIKTAERIIIFRNTRQDFGVPEEIMRVPGIGRKTYEGFKNDICVR